MTPMVGLRELPLPEFYDARNASRWSYSPDVSSLFVAAQEWRRAHAVEVAAADARRAHLLLIDVQRDFCFPEGTLYVGGRSGAGALEDSRRIAEFVYRSLGALTDVTATLDTHLAFQISFSSFWVDGDGAPVAAHREVTSDDIESGRMRPRPGMARWLFGRESSEAAVRAHALHYCRELERHGKYRLYLWPPHCLAGSDGHAMVGVVQEARLFHAYARTAMSWVETKGSNPLTENYSVLRPEVLTGADGKPIAQKNAALVHRLLGADAIIVAGQASSHCVRSTLEDLLDEIRAVDPQLARKVYVLVDCMSAVAVPNERGGFVVDFTAEAEKAHARFAEAGMHLVQSTTPMSAWPR